MKSKKLLIAVATLALIGAASVGPAMAYFTDSHIVTGQQPVNLGDSQITPHEEMDDTGFEKTVVVENNGKYDVYVRVKAYSGSTVTVKVDDENTDAKWKHVGKYYEYTDVVKAGGKTEPIVFTVTPPANSELQNDFNVIIYEEATRAEYNEVGTPVGPKWKLKIGDKHDEQPANNGEEGETNED
jgi:hypothetical protein